MKLYNTLSRQIEDFIPVHDGQVGMYVCGPTVYDYAHIGHMRKFVGDDLLRRTLEYGGFKVKMVMNITDVGHLVSDADEGEDKMEKGARKFGKTVWDVAEMFTQQFLDSIDMLNVRRPDVLCKATDHIAEQIELITALESKGFTYKTSDGIYFDTSKLADYGALARLDKAGLQEGARVEKNPEKRQATDFALWKFSYPNGRSFDSAQDDSAVRRQMEWESPWGVGFPGWHIECSAMSLKYLTDVFDEKGQFYGERSRTIDIHTGGIDHIPVHHANEIAQSEAATSKKPFVKYWLHHNFLQVEGRKMSKSLGNIFSLQDVQQKGYVPLALRYLFLTAHYRAEMNFTWEALNAAQTALRKLNYAITQLRNETERKSLTNEKLDKVDEFRERFTAAISDDLNTPQAMAVVWEVLKSNIPSKDKYDLLLEFDTVLGLGLGDSRFKIKDSIIPEEIKKLVQQREQLRKEKQFVQADRVRKQIEEKGYSVEDSDAGPKIKKLT